MKILAYITACLLLTASAFGQAISIPRSVEQVIVKGLSGGTTTAGVALSGSSTTNALQLATWSDSAKPCIGFSSGILGQVIVSGKVLFASGGLTPNAEYYLGENGTITTTPGTTTSGYITQKVIRATGTNTGVIIGDGDLGTSTASATNLDALTDVVLTTPANGQFLTYNGVSWVNGTSGASVAWGGITGTLSSQADLQSALDAKQNSLGYTAENSANKAAASGYASLDSNSKVVQNPASGTTTPGASKMLIADGSGKIDDGWLNSTVTKLGSTIELGTDTTGTTDNVTEGSSNLYYTDGKVDARIGLASIDALSDVVISSVANGQFLKYDGANWINGTSTGGGASWGSISGTLSDQTDLLAALNNKVGTNTSIATTAPLSGGGDLSTNRTVSIPKATGAQSGYLDSADFTTFSNKQAALGYTPEDSANKAVASGYASLDSNSKVVQNPASGTTTPGTSKIPIADGSGKLDDNWLNSTVTKLGSSIELGTDTTGSTDYVSEGSTNKYYTDARVNSALGSTSVNIHSDVTVSSPSIGQVLKYDGSAFVNDTDATGSGTDTPTFVSVNVGTNTAGNGAKLYGARSSVDSYGYSTKLLLHANNDGTSTTSDDSDYRRVLTAYGGVIGTSTAKFGSGSVYFDGSGDYLTAPNSADWQLTNTFTIDLWARFTTNDLNGFIGQNTDVNNYFCFFWNTAALRFQVASVGIDIVNVTASWTPTLNTWYHLAVVNNGGTHTFYVNGTQVGSSQYDASVIPAFDSALYIGKHPNDSNVMNGYLDEIRVTKGVARWTGNFTAPSSEYSKTNAVIDLVCVLDAPGDGSTQAALVVGSTGCTFAGTGFEVATGYPTLADSWDTRCDVRLKDVVNDSPDIVDRVYSEAKKAKVKDWVWDNKPGVNTGPMIDDPNIPEAIIWRGNDGKPAGFNGTGFMSYLYSLSLGIIKTTELNNSIMLDEINNLKKEIRLLKAILETPKAEGGK